MVERESLWCYMGDEGIKEDGASILAAGKW